MVIHSKPRGNCFFEGVKIIGKNGYWDLFGEKDKLISLKQSSKKNGGLICPRFADIHVHLDKTGTSQRINRRASSLFDAIDLMNEDKNNWSENDIYDRANSAIKKAWLNGTGFMRTHIDWETRNVPLAWLILKSLKLEWKGRLEIELVSLSPLDLLNMEIEKISKFVKENGSILGAFIYRNEEIENKINKVFKIASDLDIDLDFHVDEGLDREANGIDYILNSTKKFRMSGRVLCGHGCSLSIRPKSEVAKVLDLAAENDIGLVCLPTTNLWLQDNLKGKTPRLRGLAPIIEAQKLGINVMIASDNCQDPFYPFGDFNLLSVYKTAVLGAHLDESEWFESITTKPARWMGFNNEICEGGEASFLWFNADTLNTLISQSSIEFELWHKGKFIHNSFKTKNNRTRNG